MIFSCLGTLAYPFLNAGGIFYFNCVFRSITGLPCPTCGYSSAMSSLYASNPMHSFLHNPGWIFWILFQLLLVFIGIKTLLRGKQVLISNRYAILLLVLIALIWAGKFIIGSEYY
ncbi:DUF2752 domain-containing protein [Bacteroidota bacterium]